jgi:transposase-like protein/ribosomal protein L37AE/L43A
MEAYPHNLMEFDARFSSEAACRDYLVKIRWPDGFRCPQCDNAQAWLTARQLYHCTACGHDTSLTAGTVFQDTRKPLMMWFRAMWFVTSQKNGASAMGLKNALGLGSYQTAWAWLHKLRRAMVRPGRDRLRGSIELDETYIGGPEEGLRGRKIENKSLVLIAVEREGKRWARTRMRVVDNFCAETILDFVRDAIEPGSVVRTDGLNSYLALTTAGYVHDRVVQRTSKESASELLPGVHRVASLLKRWLLGTHQGAVSPQHLGYYLDEFTFRFNRRMSKHRGKLFYRLMQQAVALEATPYSKIIAQK